jgi:hypothetical protein
MTLEELGKRFVVLGRALQDDDSTMDELVTLAHDCGVQLEFRITPVEPKATADKSSDGK